MLKLTPPKYINVQPRSFLSFGLGNWEATRILKGFWRFCLYWAIPEKKRKGGWGNTFLTPCCNFSLFYFTPGNSTSFFIDPWKFYMLFLWHRYGNSMCILNSTPTPPLFGILPFSENIWNGIGMFIVGPPNPHPPNIPILHSFELTMQNSRPSLYSIETLYHLYISDPFC